jgi:hypothetical protein
MPPVGSLPISCLPAGFEYEGLPRPEATVKWRGIEVPRLRHVIVNPEPRGYVMDERNTVEHQAILAWRRMRQGWIKERTALLNRVRGLLAEFGLVPGRIPAVLIAVIARIFDEAAAPEPIRAIVQRAREQLHRLDGRLAACDA